MRGITKRFGQVFANDRIDLDVRWGEILALLGENGSGKSTFIRALTSYFPDYSGSIAFDGRELKTFRHNEREKLHSLLPQMLPHFDLSVSSFLSMYPEGKEELSKLGLGYLLEERMNTLSGGEKEMVFLAFALSRSAQLYAFDEPEAGIDLWSFENLTINTK